MGKLKIGKGPKSFKAMNAARAEKRDATARFSALRQSFSSRDDLRAAMYGSQHQPVTRDRSVEAAEQISGAMRRARSGYGADGSYTDENGARMSKAYIDNLQTDKSVGTGKGVKGENCNRTACQAPGAYWYNHSTQAYYCGTCADLINGANRRDDYVRNLGHDLLTLDPDFADKANERA